MDLKCSRCGLIGGLFLGTVICFLLDSPDAFAAEALSAGRKVWNIVLMWVNFGILVFLFIKYGKKPLMDFLLGVKTEVQEELSEVGNQFNKAKSLADVEQEKLDNIGASIDKIRESILELGRREREKIIEEGKLAAQKIIEKAENYSRYRMDLARKTLANEMVDVAFSMVQDNLKKGISEKENENLVNQFVNELKGTKRLLN
ncbi:MAG: ATP synthase F0 subunit B [Desulfobacteraceae bacterium]|nr:ATP synthase F0 subunit B [Desulfobacteraceae bacterium]